MLFCVKRHSGRDNVLQALRQRDMLRMLEIGRKLLRPVEAHHHHDIRVGIAHRDAAADLCVVQKIQLRLQLGVDLPAARKDCFRVRSLRQLQKIIMNRLTKAPPFLRCHIK